jgi:hypothetical protein
MLDTAKAPLKVSRMPGTGTSMLARVLMKI